MKSLILLMSAILMFAVAGCDGDGDGDGDTTTPPADGGNGGSGTILKADVVTATAGVATNSGTIEVSQAGIIRTVVTWTATPPNQLVSFFKKSGPTNYAWATGPSGFEGTEHIPASGVGTYTFYISNSSGPTVSVSYVIYFNPD